MRASQGRTRHRAECVSGPWRVLDASEETDPWLWFGLTYLFISHNLAVVRHMASRIGVMYLGRVVEIAPARQLFARPRMPYSRMLLGAVPDLALSGRPRIPVKGEIPNPIDPPPGCPFNPRCPYAFERCRTETPILVDGVACHAVEEKRIGDDVAEAVGS